MKSVRNVKKYHIFTMIILLLSIIAGFVIKPNKVFAASSAITPENEIVFSEGSKSKEISGKKKDIEDAIVSAGGVTRDKHVNGYKVSISHDKNGNLAVKVYDVTTDGMYYNEEYLKLRLYINGKLKLDKARDKNSSEGGVKGDHGSQTEYIGFNTAIKVKLELISGKYSEIIVYQKYKVTIETENPTIENAVPEKDGNEKINYVIIDNSIYTKKTPEIQFSDNHDVAKILDNGTEITKDLPKQAGTYKVDNPTDNTVYTLQAEDTYGLKSNTIKYVYRTKNKANFYLLTNYGYTTQEGDVFYTNKPIKFDINNDKAALLGKIEVKHNNSSSYDITINAEITEFNFPDGDGKYVFKYYDKLGFNHTRTITIYYDRENPVLNILDTNNQEIIDGSINSGGFSFGYTDSLAGVKKYTIKRNGLDYSNIYATGEKTVYFEIGTSIYYTNKEILMETLKARETITNLYNFDPTPENILKVVPKDKAYIFAGKRYYEWDNKYYARYQTLNEDLKIYLNGKIDNTNKSICSEDGEYEIEIIDKSGNKTKKTFRIHNQKLTLSLNVNNESVNINADFNNIVKNFIVTVDDLTGSNKYFHRLKYKFNNEQEVTLSDNTLSSEILQEDGNYTIKAIDVAGNETAIMLVLDRTKPIIKVQNADTKEVLVDGAYTNAPVKFEIRDSNLEDNIVHIFELVSGEWVNVSSDFQVGNLYFNALSLKELEQNNNVYYATYKLGEKTYSIKGNMFRNRNSLLEVLNSSFEELVEERIYEAGMQVNFISDDEIALVKIGERFFTWKYKVINKQASIDQGKLIFDEISISAVRKDALSDKAKEYIVKNVLSISFDAFYIADNEERTFKITASDIAGNIEEKIFNIDTKLPLIELTGKKDGNIYTLTTENGVIYTNHQEITINLLEDYTVYDKAGHKIGVNNNKINISNENKYYFKVIDRAGNLKDFSIIIDRTPVVLSGSSYYDDVLDIYYTDNVGKMKLKDICGIKEIKYTFYNIVETESEKTVLTNNILQSDVIGSSGTEEIDEGKIVIIAKDVAGNQITYTVILDNIVPEVPVLNENKKYINKINEIRLKDSGDYSSKLLSLTILNKKKVIIENGKEVVKNNNEINFNIENINLTKFTVNEFSAWVRNTGAVNDNGEYEIEVKDRAGNKNIFFFVLFQNTEKYLLNIDGIKDSFKVLKHYSVNLPSYVFGDHAGRYSFKDLETAREFVVRNEIEARVIERSDGFMYISKSNPTVAEFYDNLESLTEVVKFYAYNYIDEINIYNNGNNNYNTIIDNEFNENESYLTASNIDNFENIPTYRIKKNYVFKKSSNILNVPTSIKIAYINSFGNLENLIDIDYINKIGNIFEDNHLMQGYYAVFEEDLANTGEYTKENISYVIYYDNETPYIVADTAMGDGITHAITFNKQFIDDNTNSSGDNILRYASYKITNINDNEDNNMAIVILNGGGFKNKIYTSYDIDNIPTISYENGHYGKIKITIYDRNYNVLEYSVLIAGAKPTWTHSNEEDTKTPLTMKFSLDDSSNAFKNISIYKYALDSDNFELQNKQLIEKDSQGNIISIERLRYVFEEGGKYQVEYEDIFGRKYIEAPIFFMRNLPFAKLIGVKNKGITNKSVSLIFDNNNTIYLFKKQGGIKEQLLATEYEVLLDNKSNSTEVTIFAHDGITDFEYEVLLVNKIDRSLYKEYYFSIDSIICEMQLLNIDNENVMENTAINKPFKINVSEQGAKIEVKKKGSLNYYYEKNTLITTDGEYEITIRDRFGNTKTFIIVLDQVVDLEIKGNYYLEDEIYIANKALEINLKENIKFISDIAKKNADGSYIVNEEGKHEITIIDKRDNQVLIVVIIDYTDPSYILEGVNNNETTNSDVRIIIEEDSLLQVLYNSNKLEIRDKETVFVEDGKYEFTVKDKAGNKTKGIFIIDKKVNYSASFNINNFYTTDNITISLLEEGNIRVSFNGKEIKDKKNNFSEDGEYEIILNDNIGNAVNIKVTKIPKLAISYNLTLHPEVEIISITLNSEPIEKNDFSFNKSGKYFVKVKDNNGKFQNLIFEVDSEKPEVEIKQEKGVFIIGKSSKVGVMYKLYKNGKEIKVKNQLQEAGNYKLVVTDKLGNTNEYEFKIKKKMTIGGIIGLTLSSIALLGVTSYLLYRRHKMKVA